MTLGNLILKKYKTISPWKSISFVIKQTDVVELTEI